MVVISHEGTTNFWSCHLASPTRLRISYLGYLRKFVLVFFDDNLVCSKDINSHVQHLEMAFNALELHQLYANVKKCLFAQLKKD